MEKYIMGIFIGLALLTGFLVSAEKQENLKSEREQLNERLTYQEQETKRLIRICDTLQLRLDEFEKYPLGTPVKDSFFVSSLFGSRKGRMHWGIDVVASPRTQIYSTMSGVVSFCGWRTGYGLCVEVKNENFSTLYAHLSKIDAECYKEIKKGEIIGVIGNTGNSTGLHLHYEVRNRIGERINPLTFTEVRK